MVAQALFRMARHPLAGSLVGLGFAHAAGAIPVRRRLLDPRVIVFDHPRPAWPWHCLLVPRVRLATLVALANPARAVYWSALLLAARRLIERGDIAPVPYSLCANGGPRQDVGQVHFHLYAEAGPTPWVADQIDQLRPVVLPPPIGWSTTTTGVYWHPQPKDALHLLLVSDRALKPESPPGVLGQLLEPLPRLVEVFGLQQRGYTLYVTGWAPAERGGLQLQLLAGPPRIGDRPQA